jgi:hypothetical protein
MSQIGEGDWSDEIEGQLGDCIAEAIDDFGPDFDEEGNPLEEGESDRVKSEEEREKPGRTSSSDNGSGDEDEDQDEGGDEDEDDSEKDESETQEQETAKA